MLTHLGLALSACSYINHNRNVRQFIDSGIIDLYIRPELGESNLCCGPALRMRCVLLARLQCSLT